MFDNDYDDDGNNIVPCPIYDDIYCVGNQDNDLPCPHEEDFIKSIEAQDALLAKKRGEGGTSAS